MTLKALLESLEEVPEAVREHYTQQDDGKYILNVEAVDGFRLDNVDGLKSSLSQAREERSKLKNDFEALKSQYDGIDPKEVKQQREELEKLKGANSDEKIKAQVEAQVREHRAKWESDIETLRKERDEAQKTLKQHQVRGSIRDALSKFDLQQGADDLLMPKIEQSLKVDDEGRVVVVDENGNQRLTSKPGSDSPMDVVEYVESLKTQYPLAFSPPNGTGGAGKTPTTNRPPGQGAKDVTELPGAQALAEARKIKANE